MPRYYNQPSRGGGDSLGDFLRRQGDIAAQRAMLSGETWGNVAGAIGQLGGVVGQVFAAREERKKAEDTVRRMAARDETWTRYVESGDWAADPKAGYATARRIWGPEEGPRQFAALESVQKLSAPREKPDPEQDRKDLGKIATAAMGWTDEGVAYHWPTLRALAQKVSPEQELPERYSPELRDKLIRPVAEVWGERPKETKRDTATVPGVGLVDAQTGEVIVGAKEKAPELKAPETQNVSGKVMQFNPASGRYDIELGYTEAELSRRASAGKELKPILSGDIEDLASMQESIDLAKGLSESLKGKIGQASRLGAALPDVVTELTGLGAESKGTQAKIGVARQIIGKGLEGGVLKKEDEVKYKTMLPTVGDSDEVAEEKIQTLVKAIENKMARRLEALEDAGRDVSAYRRRLGNERGGADVEDALLKKYGY